MIEFSCSACGKHYKLDDKMAGKRAKCKCGNVLLVPLATLMDPQDPPPLASTAVRSASKSSAAVAPPPPVEKASADCPSCGAAMVPGAILCIECGFDKRTGKRLAGL